MSIPLWIEFADRDPGCVHLPNIDEAPGLLMDPSKPFGNGNYTDPEKVKAMAMTKAEELTGKKPIAVHSLPYGSGPALDQMEPGDFCYDPNNCKGRGSCPKNRACSE